MVGTTLAVALARLPGDIRAFGDHVDFLTIQGAFGDGEAIAIAANSSLLPFAIMLISDLLPSEKQRWIANQIGIRFETDSD